MENIQLIPFPIFTTNRLILRSLQIEDANEILLLRSNKKVNEFTDRPETTNIEQARVFIENIQKGIKNKASFYWAITLKDSDTLIGTICCFNISVEKSMAEIGYELHPDFHGKGIMQEAISKVISWGFEKLKLNTITALSKAGNNKSIQVLLRNNFKLDKDFKFVSREDAMDFAVYYRTA